MVFQSTGLNAFLGGIGPWNWPIPFKKVSINGRLFDPLALVPLGMSPLASFLPFLPAFFFYPPPFGPTSRVRLSMEIYGTSFCSVIGWTVRGQTAGPFAHSCQPASQSVALFQTKCQVPWAHFLSRHVSFLKTSSSGLPVRFFSSRHLDSCQAPLGRNRKPHQLGLTSSSYQKTTRRKSPAP